MHKYINFVKTILSNTLRSLVVGIKYVYDYIDFINIEVQKCQNQMMRGKS